MRKLPKNHYLIELFTKSLQGKSWLDVGSNQSDLSKALGRALSTRDFKVASHSPREPHMLKFRGSDLSEVPDKSYDYVLFNWSIGKFTTQSILNEAKRIAREGIIVQDFLAAGDRMPAGLTTPNYQLYEEQQWREILSSYGRVIVTQQLPEQALDLGMRIPMQVRLFVIQVDDVRDTLRAAPLTSVSELPSILEEGVKISFRPPVDADDFAMNIMKSSDAPACVSFPEKLVAPFPRSLEQLDEAAGPSMTEHYNGQDMVGDDTPVEQLLGMYKFNPPKEQGGVASFQTLTPEEAHAEYERIKNKPLEELTEYERFIGRTYRQGQFSTPEKPDYTNAEYAAFLDSSSGTESES